MTVYETLIREEISKIYPQLVINCEKTCGAGTEKWAGDLLPMTIDMFLEKKISKQLKVISDGKLENMLTFMMARQLKSSSSRFYHQYRKYTDRSREWLPNYAYEVKNDYFKGPFADEPNQAVECIKYLRSELDPFEKMVFDRAVVNNEKYAHLSREFDIPYYTFKATKKVLIEKMKKQCSKFL